MLLAGTSIAANDPLPSWREGKAKQQIVSLQSYPKICPISQKLTPRKILL